MTPRDTATAVSLDLDAIREREKRAHDEVVRLCTQRGARWRMQIPANPDRDSDIVIAAALEDVRALVAEVERLRARDVYAETVAAMGVDPLAVTT